MSEFKGRMIKRGLALSLGATLALTGCGTDDPTPNPTDGPEPTGTATVTPTAQNPTESQVEPTESMSESTPTGATGTATPSHGPTHSESPGEETDTPEAGTETPASTETEGDTATPTGDGTDTPEGTQDPTPTAGGATDTPEETAAQTPTDTDVTSPQDTPTQGEDTPTQGDTPVEETPTAKPDTPTPTVPGAVNVKLEVYETYPTSGAMALPTTFTSRFYFTEPYTEDYPLSVTQENMATGERVDYDLALPSNGSYAHSSVSNAPDTDYCLHLNVGADKGRYTTCYTTREPCGVTVKVGQDVVVDEFGGSLLVVRTLNGLLTAYGDDLKIAMRFDQTDPSATFPLSDTTVAIGEYDENQNIKFGVWTSSVDSCSIDANGALDCESEEVVFPLPLIYENGDPWMTLNLYLKGVNMQGTAKTSGDFNDIDGYALTGYMLYDDVVRLAAEAGSEDIAAAVDLNYDSDGDGEEDAATFRLSTSPIPVELNGCEP